MDVDADAVAVYVTVPAPWQRVLVAPKANTGVPIVALIVTVCVAVLGRCNLLQWQLWLKCLSRLL